MQESKWLYGFGVFFLGNNIQASLLSTGAFEMYLDGKLLFSKLQTGDMPSLQNLQESLIAHGIILQ